MKIVYAVIFAMLITPVLNAGDKKKTAPDKLQSALVDKGVKNYFVSKALGLFMELPVGPETELTTHQIAMFFLPASGGFAANVNIQRQKYGGSLAEYDTLSQSQLKSMNWTLLKNSLSGNEIIYEYTGKMQGKDFHWYVRALKRGDYVFLVTATSLVSQWGKLKPELLKSVNSFKLEK